MKDMEIDECTPLDAAVIGNHFETVKFLLDSGVPQSLDVNGCGPLVGAVYQGNLDIAQLLLDWYCSRSSAVASYCTVGSAASVE